MEKNKSTKKVTKKEPVKKEIKEEKKNVEVVEDKKEEKKLEVSVSTLKNIAIVVLIVILVFAISFMASNKNSKKYNSGNTSTNTTNSSSSSSTTDAVTAIQNESNAVSEDEETDPKDISVSDYLSLKKASSPSIIYIARPTCHYCQIQDPIIKNLIYKYNITVNYLNTDNMSDDDQSKLLKSDDYFKNGFGTPLTLIVKDDKIVDKKEGLTSSEDLITFFQSNDVMSK